MRPPRFSIAGLLGVIAFCGVGLAALRQPSQLWASCLFTVALAVLIVASSNILLVRGSQRIFWIGFAIWGWAYWLGNFGPWANSQVGTHLATTALLDIVYPQFVPPPPPDSTPTSGVMVGGGGGTVAMGGRLVPTVDRGESPRRRWEAWTETDRTTKVGFQIGQVALASPGPFRRIGHSLLTLLIAYIGGVATRYRFGHEPEAGKAEA